MASVVDAKAPVVLKSKRSNVLNKYRSISYVFTLSALRKSALDNPDAIRNTAQDFIILKSGGKGTLGLSTNVEGVQVVKKTKVQIREGGRLLGTETKTEYGIDKTADKLVQGFNKDSPGRFDLFIENVEIENYMAFSKGAGTSLPTSIRFDVIEPYSINGFIEALHVSSVAAGYPNYAQASFLLKMEFMGYPDGDNITDPVIIPNSTRYYTIGFTGIGVDISEKGTKYTCTAIPYNEKAFGQANVLKKPVSMTGTTVKEILENFIDNINLQQAESDKSSREPSKATRHDRYSIKFPIWDKDKGFIDSSEGNAIAKWKVTSLLKSNTLYKFDDPSETVKPNATQADGVSQPSPEEQANEPARVRYSPGNGNTKPTVQFAERAKVHECITSVIRDSEYVSTILKNLKASVDENGMVDYFLIRTEIKNLNETDENSRKPYQEFTYVVTPYKIHYTRIPGYAGQQIDESKLKNAVSLREYNYIYTGNNVDVLSFKLNFNTLFFEAIPLAMGNNDSPGARDSGGRDNSVVVKNKPDNPERIKSSENPVPSIQIDPLAAALNFDGGTGGQLQDDPYFILARNMHEAIVNSRASMLSGELEILGDPFYLVTGGIGNYTPAPDGLGLTKDGEADFIAQEVLININFRNPIDINPLEKGGMLLFDTKRVPFSGIYRVLKVMSTFKDGVFKQRLEVIRLPGQILDTNEKPTNLSEKTYTEPDNLDTIVADETNASPSRRPDALNLLLQQSRGLPSPGLPGALSNFTNATGGLGGTDNYLLNQVSGAVTNGIGRLTAAASVFAGSIPGGTDQSGSGIRLNAAAVTGLTQSSLSSGATLSSAGSTVNSSFSIAGATKSLAEDIGNRIRNSVNLVSVPGSGIGDGASIKINPVQVTETTDATVTSDLYKETADVPETVSLTSLSKTVSTGVLAAVAGLGKGASSIINTVGDKVASITNGTANDPTALASKLGINVSQLSGLSDNLKSKVLTDAAKLATDIPSDVNLSQARAQGISLDVLPNASLANLPATQPYATAPAPEPDQKFLSDLAASGGPKAVANAFGVKDVSKIPGAVLPQEILSELEKTSSLGNPLTSLRNVGGNITALGDKLMAATGQISSVFNSNQPVETRINSITSELGTVPTLVGDVSSSVVSKFGSISKGSSPLEKLMSKNT